MTLNRTQELMKNTQRWLLQQQRRKTKLVSLYQAALTHNIYPYIFYRLRFFSFNTLLLSLCWVIEYYFLFFYMGLNNAIHIAGLRFITITIYSAWWSVTEILRTRIRHYHQQKNKVLIGKEITNWLTLGYCFASIVLLGLGFFIAYTTNQTTVLKVYTILILFHISTSLITNVIRSGLYALKRINRPFLSLSTARLLGLGSILITYHWLNHYALACAYFIETLLGVGLSLYYMLRMNRIMNILPSKFITLTQFHHFLTSLYHRQTLIIFIVGLGLSSQILLFYYVFWHLHLLYSYSLLTITFIISLQFNQLFNWPNLFYFDFKRLENLKLAKVKKLLTDGLYRSSLVIASGLWLLSTLLVELFFAKWMGIVLFLFPIYLMQSYYGLKCMELFCTFRYWDIIVSAIVTTASTLLLLQYPVASYGFYFCCILIVIFCSRLIIFFTKLPQVLPQEAQIPKISSCFGLVKTVAKNNTATKILVLRLAKRTGNRQKHRVNFRLLTLGKAAYITDDLLLFVPYVSKTNNQLLANKTAGLIAKTFDTGVQPNGITAISKLIDYLLSSVLANITTLTDETIQEIQTICKTKIIDLVHQKTYGDKQTIIDDYSSIISLATRFVDIPLAKQPHPIYQVAATCDGEAIDKIYVSIINKDNFADYIKWRNYLIYTELGHVINSTLIGDTNGKNSK